MNLPPPGVLLPIITPFRDGRIDLAGYRSLVRHYLDQGIHGLVPLGTTGEAATLDETESDQLIEATVDVVNGRVPIYVGLGSNSTEKAVGQIREWNRYNVAGFLVTSPYYTLPSQQGIVEHYTRLAGSTDKQILIYNIPHRTGRNLENDTILKLAAIPNITGLKDTCGKVGQSVELLRDKPREFAVYTGEDILFHFNLTHGGLGGILASAHVLTHRFIAQWEAVRKGDLPRALEEWNRVSRVIPLLFQEPSPGPIKYLLARQGLISSPELRLPMTQVSTELGNVLDRWLQETGE